MRRLTLVVCLLLVVVARSDDVTDRKPFQGTWHLESALSGGKETQPDNLYLIFRDDAVCLKRGDQEQKEQFRITIEPSVTPKALDVYENKGDARGAKLFEAIYELDGKTLRICIAPQPGPPWNRPTELRPKDDSRDLALTLKKDD